MIKAFTMIKGGDEIFPILSLFKNIIEILMIQAHTRIDFFKEILALVAFILEKINLL